MNENRPQYTMILIVGTPKKEPLICSNSHLTLQRIMLMSHYVDAEPQQIRAPKTL